MWFPCRREAVGPLVERFIRGGTILYHVIACVIGVIWPQYGYFVPRNWRDTVVHSVFLMRLRSLSVYPRPPNSMPNRLEWQVSRFSTTCAKNQGLY
jgi:hypothetical protein